MAKKKIACIGAGARGAEYLALMKMFRGKDIEIVAVCDINPHALKDAQKRFGLDDEQCFSNTDDFFKKGRLADAVVIATQDKTHVEISMQAVELGYHILLEKPISGNYDECVMLADAAKAKGVYVVVCHVLRYSTYYKKIKETIRSGVLGEVLSINHTENVAYFHFAHSFVRGDWNKEEDSTPSLLAKCCHDIDLLYWLMDAPAVSVSSVGQLNYFCKKNAPEGATERCMGGCKHKDKCVYDAEAFYVTDPFWKAKWIKYMDRKITGKGGNTKAEIRDALKNTSSYGKCVYLSDNDVCDSQVVSIDFGNGRTVSHTMNAFSKDCFRESHIMGTKGELICCKNKLKLNVFGKYSKTLSRFSLIPGHGEGDLRTAMGFVDLLTGKLENTEDVTFIDASLESHKIIKFAEESRRKNGERLFINASICDL